VAIGNKAKIKNNELVIKPTLRNNVRNIECILFFVSKDNEIRIIDKDDNFEIRILSIAQFCKFLKVKNPLFKSADELKAESYLAKIATLEEVTKTMNEENLLLKEKIYQQENSIIELDSLNTKLKSQGMNLTRIKLETCSCKAALLNSIKNIGLPETTRTVSKTNISSSESYMRTIVVENSDIKFYLMYFDVWYVKEVIWNYYPQDGFSYPSNTTYYKFDCESSILMKMQDTGISQNYGWITLNEAETI